MVKERDGPRLVRAERRQKGHESERGGSRIQGCERVPRALQSLAVGGEGHY